MEILSEGLVREVPKMTHTTLVSPQGSLRSLLHLHLGYGPGRLLSRVGMLTVALVCLSSPLRSQVTVLVLVEALHGTSGSRSLHNQDVLQDQSSTISKNGIHPRDWGWMPQVLGYRPLSSSPFASFRGTASGHSISLGASLTPKAFWILITILVRIFALGR